jgi:hypothetical protein
MRELSGFPEFLIIFIAVAIPCSICYLNSASRKPMILVADDAGAEDRIIKIFRMNRITPL